MKDRYPIGGKLPFETKRDMKDRYLKGGYLLWVVFHLFLLFAVSDGMFEKRNYDEGIYDFVPFTYHSWEKEIKYNSRNYPPTIRKAGFSFEMHKYDITEFLFYLIVPVLLYFAYKLLRPEPEPKEEQVEDDVDPPKIDSGLPKY